MKLSGPQSDRDRIWGPRQPSQRDDLLSKYDQDKTSELETTKLKLENKALRDQVTRAMKELQVYRVYSRDKLAVYVQSNLLLLG
jgi:hypothetical protein